MLDFVNSLPYEKSISNALLSSLYRLRTVLLFGRFALACLLCISACLYSLADNLNLPSTEVDSLNLQPKEVYLPSSSTEFHRSERTYKLPLPSVVQTRFVYNPRDNVYLLSTYYKGRALSTPLAYTPAEFMRYVADRQEWLTFRQLNQSIQGQLQEPRSPIFDRAAFKADNSWFTNIFGEGGLQVQLNGSIEMNVGWLRHYTDNPALNERSRLNSHFDFGQKINAELRARLGSKLKLELSYNTDLNLTENSKRLKINYLGSEDDIIKLVEAGYVSMKPQNSLIDLGVNALGVRTKLQMGRLSADILLSQQKSRRHSIQAEGNSSKQNFEISVADYDQGRHFFLSDFFRSRYDELLAQRPYIGGGVRINRIEVWVTNKSASHEASRHILSFADLAEHSHIHKSSIRALGQGIQAHNGANSLYNDLVTMPYIRQFTQATKTLQTHYRLGWDYEQIEGAKRLNSDEYILNERLGYISLMRQLRPDETLSVAYEYSYEGEVYQVGEFSSEYTDPEQALILKLLKGSDTKSDSPYWNYMMRNVYAVAGDYGSFSGQDFSLGVYYNSPETGNYIPYLPSGSQAGKQLSELLTLDKLDAQGQERNDGRFDYIEGLTVYPDRGWVYFPSIAPFGKTLALSGVEEKYHYAELYTQTTNEAKKLIEKNKYILRGRYTAKTQQHISLGRQGLSAGSVKVQAQGRTLQEGIDYLIDYSQGIVQIINEQLQQNKQAITIDVDSEGQNNQHRQHFVGLDLNYRLSPQLNLGATAMYLQETELGSKLYFGEEAMQNLIWGAKLSWQSESDKIQRMLSRLPLNNLQGSSSISFDLEYAHLSPSYRSNKLQGSYVYLDDFEQSRSEIDLKNTYSWSLCSPPENRLAHSNNPLESAYNRGHLSWFTIDPIFTREHINQTPAYIKAKPQYVSQHYVREVETRELYPHRDFNGRLQSYTPTLNLRFYPQERGMYNLNTSRLNSEGFFVDPENSWAGIMRALDVTDFEQANIEYLEFWLMDPYLEDREHSGGDLYFNIGDISEDILPDGRKSAESSIFPETSGNIQLQENVWGRISSRTGLGYTFDNRPHIITKQDVGLDGLSNIEEQQHPSYNTYRRAWEQLVQSSAWIKHNLASHSPSNDPAGDDFRHYLNVEYDRQESPILERYKYYNGLEGNSHRQGKINNQEASYLSPDVEDINKDNNLSERNRYYEYKISLRRPDLQVGRNYIVATREVEVQFRNGLRSSALWYQFRIPLARYTSAIGGISNMQSMRFMRMYLSGFKQVTNLRFGTLRLLRGDWRIYEGRLSGGEGEALHPSGQVQLSSVNIEEHSDRKPINYVLPPGVNRSISSDALNAQQSNEQALSIQLSDLTPGEERAIYRHSRHDLRRYKNLQLHLHAQQWSQDDTATEDDEVEAFIRIGSDFKYNYYEYTLPLKLTPSGQYSNLNQAHRQQVWPLANLMDLDLRQLIALKLERNQQVRGNPIQYSIDKPYQVPSVKNKQHTISIKGNPSLSQVQTIMVGFRNRSKLKRSLEVWINELRVGDLEKEDAYALRANLDINLSDFASLQLRGATSTSGFGALTQSFLERQQDDKQNLNISSSLQLGKLLPQSWQANIPLYISYNREQQKPKYSPLDTDIKLDEALVHSQNQEHSKIQDYSFSQTSNHSFSLSGMHIGLRSKVAMPYDLANFRLNIHYLKSQAQSPEFSYQNRLSWDFGVQYEYNTEFKPLLPFAKLKGNGSFKNYLRQYGLKLWPNRLGLYSLIRHQYEEEQLRNHLDDEQTAKVPLNYFHQFVWQRKLNLQWQPLPEVSINLDTGTDARIEAPNLQVNRDLNPDGYALWREAVDRSIANLGRPQRYTQQTSISYTLPTRHINTLKFIQSNITYSGYYQWDLGATNPSSENKQPNSISNQRNITWDTQIKLKSLYSLIPALDKLERKVTQSKENKSQSSSRQNKLKLQDRLLSFLLMIKDISYSIRNTHMAQLPGYIPDVASALGQRSIKGHLYPGLGFAFGFMDESTIGELSEKGYLDNKPSSAFSAVLTGNRTIDLRANLQPIKDLSIILMANHTESLRSEYQYSNLSRPPLRGGDMQMTTISLRGFFSNISHSDTYSSDVFSSFLQEQKNMYASLKADPRLQGVYLDPYSSLVLLPAFRASYLGKGSISDKAIPHFSTMLPNWSISYNGLGRIKVLRKLFRSISLKHNYRGIFRINSYSTLASWQPLPGTPWGVIGNDLPSGQARLSLAEQISSISLSEHFFPLIGADVSLHNGISISQQWRRSRNISLNFTSGRLIETFSNEWNIGLSYHIADISTLWKPKYHANKQKQNSHTNTSSQSRGLNLKLNYALAHSQSLIRQIANGQTQLSSGSKTNRFNISADYELSRLLSLRAYYEVDYYHPLVSTRAYPRVDMRYGISVNINLKY